MCKLGPGRCIGLEGDLTNFRLPAAISTSPPFRLPPNRRGCIYTYSILLQSPELFTHFPDPTANGIHPRDERRIWNHISYPPIEPCRSRGVSSNPPKKPLLPSVFLWLANIVRRYPFLLTTLLYTIIVCGIAMVAEPSYSPNTWWGTGGTPDISEDHVSFFLVSPPSQV